MGKAGIALSIREYSSDENQLERWYKKAIDEAHELYLLTAYLTEWLVKEALNKKCEETIFLIGTDFGLTRKKALSKLLKWFPQEQKNGLLAVTGAYGFHPKLVMWVDGNSRYYIIIGSSNVTIGGFSKNVEANALIEIDVNDFNHLRDRILYLRNTAATPISEDWIKTKYCEADFAANKAKGRNAKQRGAKNSGMKVADTRHVLELPITKHSLADIRRRRHQQKKFSEIEVQLRQEISACASGKLSGADFYDSMVRLWGGHDSRFQGQGFQILGKNSDWRETCISLMKIINSSELGLFKQDKLVQTEIDRLADKEVSSRGSWLTEMVCHFFPDKYPVLNGPIKLWLKQNGYRAPKKMTEGGRYIDMAIKLRNSVRSAMPKVRTLDEADTLIWRWAELQKNKQRRK